MTEHTRSLSHRQTRWIRLLFLAVSAYLAVAWVASYAVDVRDALGIRSMMISLGMDHPALWYHLFYEGRLTEMLQWFALAGATVGGALAAGRYAANGEQTRRWFWTLLAMGTALMLIEDAGNIRHTIAIYPNDAFPALRPYAGIATRALVMLLIALVPLTALVRFGGAPLATPTLRGTLVVGFTAYGIAATLSATSGLVGTYDAIGAFIWDTVTHGELLRLDGRDVVGMGNLLADTVFEESVELVGATALCAAAQFERLRSQQPDAG